jgi:hypothetical protein
MAYADAPPEPTGRELKPGNRIHDEAIRLRESAHVADEDVGAARLQQGAPTRAERGQVGWSERAAKGEHGRGRPWGHV